MFLLYFYFTCAVVCAIGALLLLHDPWYTCTGIYEYTWYIRHFLIDIEEILPTHYKKIRVGKDIYQTCMSLCSDKHRKEVRILLILKSEKLYMKDLLKVAVVKIFLYAVYCFNWHSCRDRKINLWGVFAAQRLHIPWL